MSDESAADGSLGEPQAAGRTSLGELARLFLKLGTTAFGGPAAHIAIMEEEVVRRRRWLTHNQFLDMLGATNLIPGPNSTEMAIHIGYERAGFRGLLVAGTCFVIPATLIVATIAAVYVRYGQVPAADALLYGIKPVVIAVVVQALWGLGKAAVKTRLLAGVAVAAVMLGFAGVHEMVILFGGAGLVAAAEWLMARRRGIGAGSTAAVAIAALLPTRGAVAATAGAAAAGVAAAGQAALWPIFLIFLKIGSVLFGSGYVLLAIASAVLLIRYRINSPWLVLAGGIAGLVFR